MARLSLERAIRHAEAEGTVRRNVAALVDSPEGQEGRPSKSLSFDQAVAVIRAAKQSRLHGYVVVCTMTGVRTEEARALLWSHIVTWDKKAEAWRPVTEAGWDHEKFAVWVWRSVRKHGEASRMSPMASRLSMRAMGICASPGYPYADVVTGDAATWEYSSASRSLPATCPPWSGS